MRARRAPVAMLACAAAALGGCATVSTHAQDASLAALAKQEPGPGPAFKYGTPTKSCEAHPTRSLPALRRLPQPGQMPAGTFERRIRRRGQLIVGVDQNSLGLGYFNPGNGRMEGFDSDLVREVARAIFGSTTDRIRYVAISTEQRPSAIANADVDMVASAFSVTCKRRTRMLFSTVYHVAHQRLLVPRHSKVTHLFDPDLRGQRVCVTKTSTSFDALRRSSARTGIKPYGVVLRSDCLTALQEGLVAAITSDDAILLGFRRQDPQTAIVGPTIEGEHYAIAINQAHPDFVRFVNAVLARVRRDGCLAALRRHWLGALTVPAPDRPYERCTREDT